MEYRPKGKKFALNHGCDIFSEHRLKEKVERQI